MPIGNATWGDFTVNSEVEMLDNSQAVVGTTCFRTDVGAAPGALYTLGALPPSVLANWGPAGALTAGQAERLRHYADLSLVAKLPYALMARAPSGAYYGVDHGDGTAVNERRVVKFTGDLFNQTAVTKAVVAGFSDSSTLNDEAGVGPYGVLAPKVLGVWTSKYSESLLVWSVTTGSRHYLHKVNADGLTCGANQHGSWTGQNPSLPATYFDAPGTSGLSWTNSNAVSDLGAGATGTDIKMLHARSMCEIEYNGTYYWARGQYNTNGTRTPGGARDYAGLYLSPYGGYAWSRVFEWNQDGNNRQIAHIHAVIPNTLTGGIVVCTGDSADEVGLLTRSTMFWSLLPWRDNPWLHDLTAKNKVQTAVRFTAKPASGATGATLNAPWPYATDIYTIQLNSDTNTANKAYRTVTLTNLAVTCDWTAGGGAFNTVGSVAIANTGIVFSRDFAWSGSYGRQFMRVGDVLFGNGRAYWMSDIDTAGGYGSIDTGFNDGTAAPDLTQAASQPSPSGRATNRPPIIGLRHSSGTSYFVTLCINPAGAPNDYFHVYSSADDGKTWVIVAKLLVYIVSSGGPFNIMEDPATGYIIISGCAQGGCKFTAGVNAGSYVFRPTMAETVSVVTYS